MPTLPPCWVINLERSPDRREFARAAFGAIGLEFEFFPAVDGRLLGGNELRRYSEARSLLEYGRGLTSGELGVALSHLETYKRIVSENIPEVVIFEDDVRPTTAIIDILEQRKSFPSTFDLVTFHSLFAWAGPQPIAGGALGSDHFLCSYDRTPMGTQCYLITRQAAARVLDCAFPIRLPADELLFRRRPAGLEVYGIEPTPVDHGDFSSELHRMSEPAAVRSIPAPVRAVLRAVGKARRRASRPR